LEKNLDKVDWTWLSLNPSIFQVDYDAMRENKKIMAEEIAKIVWHPSRMYKWPEDQLIDDSDSETDIDSLNMQNISITSTIRTIKISIKRRS
jgi:hypothetical protein